MITCHSLSKHYGSLKALDELDLELIGNEPTGLVGANGAGKSTLFALLCGFTRPTKGDIKIFGKSAHSENLKGRISILPQDINMFRSISVFHQLCHFARLQGFSRASARTETERVLSLINIMPLAIQYPETLSFGQRKKVMLAQALIGKPELIMLDEPTSGLDPVAVNDIHLLLKQLAADHRLMISSHNLGEIEGICQQIVVLNRGKLVKTTSVGELKRVSQCFRIFLEQNAPSNINDIFKQINNIERIEVDIKDSRKIQIFCKDSDANTIQIQLMNALHQQQISIAEFSKGTALADEISELLRNDN